ncbi:MAG: hypothetical protein PWQ45_1565 [Thermosipho sp. (in: thermotogales)]|nr:hypothetical protein [Thermosipho sp. (in: thermotogales)]
MQVTLDQLLSVIMARLESMETMIEDLKLKENIALRLLSKKTGVTKEDLQEAVKEEFETMKKAGMIESEETETTESEKAMVEELYKWISGDVEELKKQIEEYKKKKVALEASRLNIKCTGPARTRDGRQIELVANIRNAAEVKIAREYGADCCLSTGEPDINRNPGARAGDYGGRK